MQFEALEDRRLLTFLPAVNYATGLQSYSVATADFNHDGKPDLVVENLSSNYMSVLLGNGDGTFQAARNFTPGSSFVAVGDFNGDGAADIVLSSATSNSIGVVLGNGDGTFRAPETVAIGLNAESAAVGDFNQDGKLDIVAADGDELGVVLGNGDGTFQAPQTFSLPGQFPPGYTGSTPVPQTHPSLAFDSVVVGDVNKDGKLDLVVLGETDFATGNYDYYGYAILQTNGYVNVLLGNGDGTFATASTTLTNASDLTSAAVGDLNGDGKLDVVTSAFDTNSVGILLGNGDGTLQAATYVALGGGTQQPQSVAVADFNGDGKLDIATANHNYWDIDALLGNGDGTFQSPLTYPTPYAAESLAVGDFNGDGFPDLAVANSNPDSSASNLSVLINANDWSTPANASPATLLVAGFPSPTTAGVPGAFTVTAKNADGTTATGYNGTVTVNTSDPTVYSQSYTFTPADQGSHTFSVTMKTPGMQSITVTDIRTLTVTGTEPGITVNPAAASYLNVGPLNNGTTAGKPFGVYVQAVDPYANAATGYTGTVHFTSSDPLAILPPDYTFTAADGGYHNFVNVVTLLTSGLQTVTATDTVNGSVTGTATFLVDGGVSATASALSVAGFPSPTTAGLPGAFTITAKNAEGTTATGYTGTVHFTSSDPSAALPANYTFTAADAGTHTFSATLKTADTQSITATDATTGTITGSQTGITVTPAAASHFAVSAPAGSTAGSAFSVTARAVDPYNNTATGYAGTIHFTSSDGQASLPADYTFTAGDAGVHTFTNAVTLKTAGMQTVMATDKSASSINGSSLVQVAPAAAGTMVVSGFPSPTTAGAAGSFIVTLTDAYGDVATGYTGTVHYTSSDANAVLPGNYTFTAADAGRHTFSATLKTAGTQSITVTDATTASLTAADAGITVKPSAASQFILSARASVTAGVPFSLTVTVEDAYGNVVTGYTGTIHFKSTDKADSLPADYTFTAGDNGVHTFTGLVLKKKGNDTVTVSDTHNSSITGKKVVDVV